MRSCFSWTRHMLTQQASALAAPQSQAGRWLTLPVHLQGRLKGHCETANQQHLQWLPLSGRQDDGSCCVGLCHPLIQREGLATPGDHVLCEDGCSCSDAQAGPDLLQAGSQCGA